MSRLRPIVTGGTTCGRHQYGDAPLRPWRYESLRVSAVRAFRLRIRDRMDLQFNNIQNELRQMTYKRKRNLGN
eukprot:5281817-Pleurochrysis_carterae.AAC.1